MIFIETIKLVGAVASAFLSVLSLIVFIVKPIRNKLVSWFRSIAGAERIEDVAKLLQEYIEANDKRIGNVISTIEKHLENEKIGVNADKDQCEALQGIIRNALNHLYYKYLPQKTLPIYERENIVKLYEIYKKLKGNSYVEKIYDEMMTWGVGG